MVRKRGVRKTRISEEQIMEMLRLHRQGMSISAIAQATGCHRQTVKAYLVERQADILADEVKKQVLVEELRNHFRELPDFAALGFKGHLDASVSESPSLTGPRARTPGPISVAGYLGLPGRGSASYQSSEWSRMYLFSARDTHLIQAIREHLRDSDLWVHWDAWRKEVAEYETPSRKLLEWVDSRMETERWQKIDPEYIDSVRWWLFGNILRKTGGAEYEKLETRGVELTTPGARRVIARCPDGAKIKELHDWLLNTLDEAGKLPECASLEAATHQLMEKQPKLKDIILKIDLALDGIALMRACPGRCHLCPV
jgi:hypothetical protein